MNKQNHIIGQQNYINSREIKLINQKFLFSTTLYYVYYIFLLFRKKWKHLGNHSYVFRHFNN
jgi:hypothetical protein